MKRKKLRISGFYCIFWWLSTNTEATFIRLSVLNLMTDSGGFSKTVQTTMPAGEYCNIIDSCSSKVRLGSLVQLHAGKLFQQGETMISSSTTLSLWTAVPTGGDSGQLFHLGGLDCDQRFHHIEPLISCSITLSLWSAVPPVGDLISCSTMLSLWSSVKTPRESLICSKPPG